MKWNILVATMVLGLGLSTQSFGFDLLNRMLGSSGSEQKGSKAGCCDAGALQKACHDGCAQKNGTKNGHCHVQRPGLGLGLLSGCAQKCCDDPKGGTKNGTKNGHCHVQRAGLGLGLLNGCAQKGCDDGKGGTKNGTKNGGCHVQRAGLGLGLLNGSAQKCCDDGKGTKDSAQKGLVSRVHCGPSLLDRIFACRRPVCCDPKGGKGTKGTKGGWDGKDDMKIAPVPADEPPMPPAPVVDAEA